jgi:hypothetical protein
MQGHAFRELQRNYSRWSFEGARLKPRPFKTKRPVFPVLSTKKFRPAQFVHNRASIFHCGDFLLRAQYRQCKREMS